MTVILGIGYSAKNVPRITEYVHIEYTLLLLWVFLSLLKLILIENAIDLSGG